MTKNETNKGLFKKYIKLIKESEILKTQFFVYENLENRIDSDPISINLFISENIKLFDKFNPKEIIKENERLTKIIPEGKLPESYELSNLHESISNLIFTKRSPHTINKVTEDIKNVTTYIINNKPKKVNECIELPQSIFLNLVVEKYNEKYNSLDKLEKDAVGIIADGDFEARKAFYKKVVDECLKLVENSMIEADESSKDKLLKVKTKLLNERDNLNEDKFVDEILKLIDLRSKLLDN